jgi:hypothetical protein
MVVIGEKCLDVILALSQLDKVPRDRQLGLIFGENMLLYLGYRRRLFFVFPEIE